MAIYFDPEVILYNAFLSKQKTNKYKCYFITFYNLRKFCNNLYNKITRIGYKYVVINGDTESIDFFCDRNNDFIRGIYKMFCTCKISSADVEKINKKYPEDIRVILNTSETLW